MYYKVLAASSSIFLVFRDSHFSPNFGGIGKYYPQLCDRKRDKLWVRLPLEEIFNILISSISNSWLHMG